MKEIWVGLLWWWLQAMTRRERDLIASTTGERSRYGVEDL